jgi:putative transposase
MPRRARTVAAGFPMHAILRGIDRAVIFFHDSDYRVLLDMLAERAAAESVRIHAYVLMTNHLHLLMTPETERGPSSLMKGLGQRYVQHINRTDRRTGTLFEGRFRSSVIEADTYLLACQRYIELNPVRAGMVQAPGDYPWSSYRGNALGEAHPVLAPHPVYSALAEAEVSRSESSRRRAVCRSRVVSNRHPFARPALPGVTARMGGSDFQAPPPVSSLLHLFTGARFQRTDARISLVTTYSQCQARHGLGPRGVSVPLARARHGLLPAGGTKPSALTNQNFRGSTPSGSASPVTFAPRLLSCLRIDAPVTSRAARLDTGLAAHDYPGGTSPARTRGLARPHCPSHWLGDLVRQGSRSSRNLNLASFPPFLLFRAPLLVSQ